MAIYEVAGFRFRLPKWAKARIAEEDSSILKILDLEENFHCACPLSESKKPGTIKAMLNNLGCAIFEKEHPGMYMALVKEKARMVMSYGPGARLSAPWSNLDKRLKELSY